MKETMLGDVRERVSHYKLPNPFYPGPDSFQRERDKRAYAERIWRERRWEVQELQASELIAMMNGAAR